MYILNTEKRDTGSKPNQLRRKGLIPGVLYGKSLEESLSIQISQREIVRFLQANSTGSKVELVVGDEKFMTLLRDVSYKSTTNELEHISFQALQAEEVVESTMIIVLLNKEKVSGIVQQTQSEISYRALPLYLVDRVEIDLQGMKKGDSIRIGDLDIAKDPNIEILNPFDIMVVSIVDNSTLIQKSDDETEGEASETDDIAPKAE